MNADHSKILTATIAGLVVAAAEFYVVRELLAALPL